MKLHTSVQNKDTTEEFAVQGSAVKPPLLKIENYFDRIRSIDLTTTDGEHYTISSLKL